MNKSLYQIVYTKDNDNILDIGLMIDWSSNDGVLARATKYDGDVHLGHYGGCTYAHWIESGKYCTIEDWKRVTYEKTQDEVCEHFGIDINKSDIVCKYLLPCGKCDKNNEWCSLYTMVAKS